MESLQILGCNNEEGEIMYKEDIDSIQYAENEVTNQDIIEYLSLAYNVLSCAKSNVDLVRLKRIINILKRDAVKSYPSKKKGLSDNINMILKIVAKKQEWDSFNDEEKKILQEYFASNLGLQFVLQKKFSELYTFLQEQGKSISASDLKVIYVSLVKEDTKLKKKDDILNQIILYLNQSIYFDNMDERYSRGIKADEANTITTRRDINQNKYRS